MSTLQKNKLNQPTYPIPSREEILGVLRTSGSPLSAADIAKALSVTRKEHDGFIKRLTAMERDGQLELNRKGRYELAHQPNFIEGRVVGHRDGYGFFIRDDGEPDIFLPEREMQKAMHGDRALVRVIGYDRRGRSEGQIVEMLERANRYVIGRLLSESGTLVVAPEDKRLGRDILIAPKGQGKAKVGQVVSVEILEYPDRYVQPIGRVVEVLGEIDDPGMEIEIAVRKYGVPHEFSEATLRESEALPDVVRESDLAGRIDLRDVPLVTIDGEDARDFDDAVYCEPVKIGRSKGWRLVVAIADVSHYVQPGKSLDVDAIDRATSVYFPRRVIPMLPEKLSNGLCSLNPEVDRLCMVCDAVITAKGQIKAYQFYPAVMHSAARLTYNEVWSILSNVKGPEAAKRAPLVPHLQDLYELFQVLLKARRERGAIDFDTTETYIVCNAQGKIEQILPRTRNDAHRLIEECMLTANVCAAEMLERYKHPALYRVHAGPTEEKLQALRAFLKTSGLTLGGGDKPQAADYAELMEKIIARPDAPMLQTMLLRSMQQAVYSPDNVTTSAWRTRPTRTSPARSAAIRTCWCTGPSRPSCSIRAMCRRWRRACSSTAGFRPRRAACRPRPTRPRRPPSPARPRSRRSGTSWACIARPTSAAPTRLRATWRPGSSATSCAISWAMSSPARLARSPRSASSCSSTSCTWRVWCT